jgi:hypothetical protein
MAVSSKGFEGIVLTRQASPPAQQFVALAVVLHGEYPSEGLPSVQKHVCACIVEMLNAVITKQLTVSLPER